MFSWQGLGPSAWVVARRKSPEQEEPSALGKRSVPEPGETSGTFSMICQGICISVTAIGGRLAEWAFRWPQQPNPFFFRLKASREPSRVSLRRHPRAPARKLPLAFPTKEPLAKRHAGLRSHQGKTSENSLNTVRFRRSAEHASFDFVPRFAALSVWVAFATALSAFSISALPKSPFPASVPATRSFNGLHPKSKLRAFTGDPGEAPGNSRPSSLWYTLPACC